MRSFCAFVLLALLDPPYLFWLISLDISICFKTLVGFIYCVIHVACFLAVTVAITVALSVAASLSHSCSLCLSFSPSVCVCNGCSIYLLCLLFFPCNICNLLCTISSSLANKILWYNYFTWFLLQLETLSPSCPYPAPDSIINNKMLA